MATAALVLTGCNCTKKMLTMPSGIKAECNPTMLALKGSNVPADITVTFAAKSFEKSTTLKMIPVLVFDGGEIAGDAKFVQGEKVKDNYTVIPNEAGGQVSMSVNFPYDKRAQVCTLELRIEGKCGKDTEFQPVVSLPIAKGITDIQSDFNPMTILKSLPDNFQKTVTIDKQAKIMYDINKSDVKKDQLSSEEIKALEAFVKDQLSKGVAIGAIQSKGYASPDGPVELNDKLSQKRSESAKAAVQKQMGKEAAKIVAFDLASYGEDWTGFKALVMKSDIKDKDLVLQVLNMYNSPVERDAEIHKLSAAFDQLATDVLPQLRRTVLAASAQVKGKSDDELMAAAKNDPGSLTADEALYIARKVTDTKERINLLQTVAQKTDDARVYNNLGVEMARSGNLNGAASALKAASQKGTQPEINDNLGLVALATGDMKTANDCLSKSQNPQAKAALSFAKGDYSAATQGLQGYDLAVAQLANNNIAAAKSAIATAPADAKTDYLKAVIAAREGDSKGAIANLSSSIAKDASMKAKAKTDAEFTALFASPEFQALVK